MLDSSHIPDDPSDLNALPEFEETFSPPVQAFVDQLLEMERGPDPSDLNTEDRNAQEDRLKQSLSDLAKSGEALPTVVEARSLIYLGRIWTADFRHQKAEDALTDAHDVFRAARAMPWQGEALYYRGINRLIDKRFKLAGADLEQARRLWTKAGQPERALTAMNAKATMQFFIGEFESARLLYRRILVQTEDDDTDAELAIRHNLATIAVELGEPDEAVGEYETILSMLQERTMRVEEAKCRQNLGAAFVSLERYDEGIEQIDAALAIYRDTGNRTREAETMHNKAFLLQQMSRLKEAYELFRDTLTLRLELDDEAGQGMTLAQLGILAADDLERPEPGLRLVCAGQRLLDDALDWRRNEVANWVLELAKEQGIAHPELDQIWKESEELFYMDMGKHLIADAFPDDIDWAAASEKRKSWLEEMDQYMQDLTLRYLK